MSATRILVVHLWTRGRAAAGSLEAAATLLLFALVAVWYGPRVVPELTAGGLGGPFGTAIWALWLWLWPALPVTAAGGRAAGGATVGLAGTLAMPALPIGPRRRAIAEAGVVLAVLTVAWLIAGVTRVTSAGGLVAMGLSVLSLVPTALAWACPARTSEIRLYRPLVVAAALGGVRAVGWSVHPAGEIGATVLATAMVLATCTWQPSFVLGARAAAAPLLRWRRPRPPRAQLDHDTWAAPLAAMGGWLPVSMLLLAGAVALDTAGRLPEWGFLIAANAFLVVAMQLVLRPLGSDLLVAGLAGRHGARRGDFLAAWAVLPVSRVTVLRRVWLHGAVSTLATWLVIVVAIVARAQLRHGRLALLDGDGGDISQFARWTVILAPMMAGFLVVAADGRRIATTIAALALVLGFQTMFLSAVLMTSMGWQSVTVELGTVAFQLVLLAAAALPALWSLRRARG